MNKSTHLILAGIALAITGFITNKAHAWSSDSTESVSWFCNAMGIILILCGFHTVILVRRWFHYLCATAIIVCITGGVFNNRQDLSLGNKVSDLLEVLAFAVLYFFALTAVITNHTSDG